jgi:type II secretory pathway component PulF
MDLIHQNLSELNALATYPLIAMLIFFIVFIGIVVYVVRVDKSYLSQMSRMPLDTDINVG